MQKYPKPTTAVGAQGSIESIRRDEETGDIILSPQRKRSWHGFFKRLKQFRDASGEIPADFMADRG
ncbi:MAG TPA: hypothetical protein VN666_01295 [Nitrospira sp.]|nr:hypothetical protein [Nitrospira sp.]